MTLREEREYLRSAQAVLEIQRGRCLKAAEALAFWIDQIRKTDLTPEDLKIFEDCKQYIAARKPPASETSTFREARRA